MKTVLIALTLAAANASAAGLPSTLDPREYCAIGAEIGYPTRPYNDSTGGCASEMVAIGAESDGGGLANNLAFYSTSQIHAGQPKKLERVSLILNVNNAAETARARNELIRAATAASKRLLGAVPAGFVAAIKEGKTATWKNAQWRSDVIYSSWPNGRGHDISVRFTPAGAR